MLVNNISLQEAKSSSEIENIFTTEDEIYQAITTTDTSISPEAKEGIRNRESLWIGIEELKREGDINLSLIIKVFQKIKQTTTGIRPQHSNVRIIKGGKSLNSGENVYTPPKGDKLLNDLLLNCCDFINNDDKYNYAFTSII